MARMSRGSAPRPCRTARIARGLGIHAGVHQGVAAVLQGDQVRPDCYRAQFLHYGHDAATAHHRPVFKREGAEAEHGKNNRHQNRDENDDHGQSGNSPLSESSRYASHRSLIVTRACVNLAASYRRREG